MSRHQRAGIVTSPIPAGLSAPSGVALLMSRRTGRLSGRLTGAIVLLRIAGLHADGSDLLSERHSVAHELASARWNSNQHSGAKSCETDTFLARMLADDLSAIGSSNCQEQSTLDENFRDAIDQRPIRFGCEIRVLRHEIEKEGWNAGRGQSKASFCM